MRSDLMPSEQWSVSTGPKVTELQEGIFKVILAQVVQVGIVHWVGIQVLEVASLDFRLSLSIKGMNNVVSHFVEQVWTLMIAYIQVVA